MELNNLFDRIDYSLKKQLPFVAYRKSNNKKIKSLFQEDDTLHFLNDFSRSGFIFAPFDDREKTIFFPKKKCESHTIENPVSQQESNKDQSIIVKSNSELMGKKNHIKLVQNGIDLIKEGEVSKVVLSRIEEVEFQNKELSKIFQNLLKNYPLAFVYLWYHPKVGLWMGASPETLLSVKNKEFKTMALAGTQPYIDSLEVHWGEKEKEEQSIVTDFIVAELRDFDFNISNPFTKKAGSLLHICTEIEGRLNSNDQLVEVIKKLHPTPAICGLPKEKAKEFIIKNENYNREFYTGFLGELNIDNSTNLFVNLRCMQIKNNKAIVYVGGGITLDSIPENEWQETVEKSDVMKRVMTNV